MTEVQVDHQMPATRPKAGETMSDDHRMVYQAGIASLGRAQSTEPRWECSCGKWRFRAQAMPRRKTGNNRREAELSFTAHRDNQPGGYGAGPGYN